MRESLTENCHLGLNSPTRASVVFQYKSELRLQYNNILKLFTWLFQQWRIKELFKKLFSVSVPVETDRSKKEGRCGRVDMYGQKH